MKLDYDKLAQAYAQHRRIHPGVLQALAITGNMQPESTVLEIGCGTGNYITALHQAAGPVCWGAEPSIGMLKKALENPKGVQYVCTDAHQLSFAAACFNLCFSVDVIHHVQDHASYFKRAYHILKSGGKICTVTDSEAIIRKRQPLAVYFPETIQADLKRYPSMGRLKDLIAASGFSNLHEEHVSFPYAVADIQPFRAKAYSCLHLISETAFQAGLARMEADFKNGPLVGSVQYLLLWGDKP